MPVTGPPLNEPMNLPDLLQRGLAANPEDAALVSRETRWTWGELDETSDRLASLMPNRAVLVILYLACIKAGLVATPLNYRYMVPEIDHALEVSRAAVLLHHAERDADVAASRLAKELPLGVVRYGAHDGERPSLEELIEQEAPTTALGVRKPSDPAFIFFTSGSTGKPKGVTHSVETFGWLVASGIESLAFTPQDVVLPGSSLSHVGALALSLTGLAAGARVLIARTFDGDELLPLLREDRPTFLCMLPAALFGLGVCAGEPLPHKLICSIENNEHLSSGIMVKMPLCARARRTHWHHDYVLRSRSRINRITAVPTCAAY